jgi:glycosyltransferase involved in cell wall biosynthesis
MGAPGSNGSLVLINARAGSRPELGGVERYARELARRLPILRPDGYRVAYPRRRLLHRLGHAWEQAVLPARAARLGARAILSPANAAPVMWPRNVVVIHDAAALRHPQWYAPSYVALHRALLPRLARTAEQVITVSRFSQGELVELLGAPPERVKIIAGGVDERFRPDADARAAAQALGLQRPYVLTVGSLIARKNLAALEPAARELDNRGLDLVAAGGGRPQLRPERARSALRALGHVDDALLPGLYAGARAFVLASHYEGFGLPCVEAMASGVPVVAADRGALPETCDGAAAMVDPDDPASIVAALLRVCEDEELRRGMIARGIRRASELTWDRTAREMDALLLALS